MSGHVGPTVLRARGEREPAGSTTFTNDSQPWRAYGFVDEPLTGDNGKKQFANHVEVSGELAVHDVLVSGRVRTTDLVDPRHNTHRPLRTRRWG